VPPLLLLLLTPFGLLTALSAWLSCLLLLLQLLAGLLLLLLQLLCAPDCLCKLLLLR
jgi:hypothetical protein